jgi:hypothetical protein
VGQRYELVVSSVMGLFRQVAANPRRISWLSTSARIHCLLSADGSPLFTSLLFDS